MTIFLFRGCIVKVALGLDLESGQKNDPDTQHQHLTKNLVETLSNVNNYLCTYSLMTTAANLRIQNHARIRTRYPQQKLIFLTDNKTFYLDFIQNIHYCKSILSYIDEIWRFFRPILNFKCIMYFCRYQVLP